jgi:ubiquinone/menaquinone biosynthesis C-methylase UbiE
LTYVHGYTDRETQRLLEQSLILEELIHEGTIYPSHARVLEVGCGVGAQTRILSRRNPGAQFLSLEISEESISIARKLASDEQITNVEFMHGDILSEPFSPESFDHIFVCFVLEHLRYPDKALKILSDALKTGGTITVIEGDHGSGFWTPETLESRKAWEGLVTSQEENGHDPNIGRRVYPLLHEAGFSVQEVSPRWVYADQSNPVLLDGVINQIIAPMVYSAEDQVLESKLMEQDRWSKGLKDLKNVAQHPEGTFFYTWFKGFAIKK